MNAIETGIGHHTPCAQACTNAHQEIKSCLQVLEYWSSVPQFFGESAGGRTDEWRKQLQRCNVLVDDFHACLLRPDASATGVLPAESLRTLRMLFYSELQPRLCEFALGSVSAAATTPTTASTPTLLSTSLEVLSKVLATVKSVDAMPVRI